MDVYLVPIGPERYECYYEAPDHAEIEEPVEGQGFFARLRARFNEQLKEAEEARHQRSIAEPQTFLGRMQKRTMRWIAERVAEQRLLWHLRRTDRATLHTPGDQTPDQSDAIMRAMMKRDADYHRNRMIIHGLALIVSVPIAIVPGPNVIGYLFTFTAVGHYLSWRGAVNALREVSWTLTPNDALGELQRAFALEPAARHRLIREVALRLHMPRMATFVERMTAATT